MTKNLKNIEAAARTLNALHAQVVSENKADPRFKRTVDRANHMIRILDVLKERYELIHSRKVPAKVAAKKAGVAKKTAPKKAAKKTKPAKKSATVHQLHPTKAAAASATKRGNVKRSK